MLTRRSPKFTGLLHAFGLFGLSTVLVFASACDDDKGDDDNADETGNGDGKNDNNDNDDNDDNDDNSTNDDNDDSSADICDDACVNLESCGVPINECLGICTGGACGTCLANSGSCGQDCAEACAPGGDGDGDPTGDGDGDPTGDGDGDPPPDKECVINDDCGLSFECVSCSLTDNEGWCEQSSDCNTDTDCGFGGKCGYNVESGDWRCLPADYCE